MILEWKFLKFLEKIMDKIKENLNYILLAIVAILVCILAVMMFSKKNVYNINTGNSTVLKKNYVVTHNDNKIFMYKNENLILKQDYDDKSLIILMANFFIWLIKRICCNIIQKERWIRSYLSNLIFPIFLQTKITLL